MKTSLTELYALHCINLCSKNKYKIGHYTNRKVAYFCAYFSNHSGTQKIDWIGEISDRYFHSYSTGCTCTQVEISVSFPLIHHPNLVGPRVHSNLNFPFTHNTILDIPLRAVNWVVRVEGLGL